MSSNVLLISSFWPIFFWTDSTFSIFHDAVWVICHQYNIDYIAANSLLLTRSLGSWQNRQYFHMLSHSSENKVVPQNENQRKNTWVFLFQKYVKFEIVSQEHFIKHKPLIYEVCSISFKQKHFFLIMNKYKIIRYVIIFLSVIFHA